MTHKFSFHNKHKLDNERRRKILPPYQTLSDLGLKQGDIMADIGCGIGYFTIPASEIVGEAGKVFAMDISLNMIEEVEQKAEKNDIKNIRTIVTQENDLKIESDLITFAFLSTVLHEVEDTDMFLSEIKRILKDRGRIAIVEWEKKAADEGPSFDHRIAKEDVETLLREAGFKNVRQIMTGENFYAMIAQKQSVSVWQK